MISFSCFLQKYYGRKSPVGRDVCRLRKAYYNARHEASAQIDEIVGETASEADSSETSVSEKENGHEKDDDVIRCICGLYKDEGLMIQCDKCMVRVERWSRGLVLMSVVTVFRATAPASLPSFGRLFMNFNSASVSVIPYSSPYCPSPFLSFSFIFSSPSFSYLLFYVSTFHFTLLM